MYFQKTHPLKCILLYYKFQQYNTYYLYCISFWNPGGGYWAVKMYGVTNYSNKQNKLKF